MLLVLCASAGVALGFTIARRHGNKIQEAEERALVPAARKALKDGRRAVVIGHGVLRAAISRAFFSTARRHAPVPVTFSRAVLANYLPMLATATGGTLIVIAFCRVAWNRVARRDPRGGGDASAADLEDKENVAVSAVEALLGLSLYAAGKEAWNRGPLRGGLSVFGAGPSLDEAASRERYLAEKLAEFSGAATGGVTSLAHLGRLSVSDRDVADAVGALVSYARRSAGVQTLLVAPEIGEAWSEFAARTQAHGRDMRSIASHVYYPSVPGADNGGAHRALMVVNATDPVVRFARASRDCGAVLAQLLSGLGPARGGVLTSALSSLLLGTALGCEAAAWLP